MPVDNRIYEDLDDWWDPAGRVAGLHAMNPARSAYFLDVLGRRLGLALPGLRVLDLGCGGGLLSESLARAGLQVVALDRAHGALVAARAHARQSALGAAYVRADAAALPFASGSLPAVLSSDLLEHLDDLGLALREVARVIAPGGAFLFDTINRTWLTWLFHIGVVQEWKELVPPDTHEWRRFVRPAELERALAVAGLQPIEKRGLQPEHPLRFTWRLLRHRRGRDRMGPFKVGEWTAGSYLGFARKPG